MKKIDNIVIGAGIAGLSLGYFLQKKNLRFKIFESKNTVGGNINSSVDKDFLCENGPNTVLLNNQIFEELIKDLGLGSDIIYSNKSSNKRYIIKGEKMVLVPNSFISFLKTNLISNLEKIRILKDLIVKKNTKDISVEEFIVNRFGKGVHDNLFEPFLKGVYAGNTREMSAKYSLKNLWKLQLSYRSLIIGFLFSKKNKKSEIIYFKNGFNQLIESIKNKLNGNIECGNKIVSIEKKENYFLVRTDKKEKYICNKIYFTVPAYSLAIIKFIGLKLPNFNNVIYNPIDVIHLGFKRKNANDKISGFGLLTRKVDNKHFLGVLFNSEIFPNVCSKKNHLITVLLGGDDQKDIVNFNEKEILENIKNEMKGIFNIKSFDFQKHYRWRKGIPSYSLDHGKLIKEIKDFNKKEPNLFFLGNYIDGVSVGDCILKSYNCINN